LFQISRASGYLSGVQQPGPTQPAPNFASYLSRPVIPYLTTDLDDPTLRSASVLFIGGGELADLPRLLSKLDVGPLARIPVLLQIDLVEGLSSDEAGVRYVATLERIDGIITTRHHLAPLARKRGLMSVVRLVLQDGRAVDRGLHVIERSRPDAVEVLPGVAFLQVADRFQNLPTPIIAGGLIRTPDEVKRIIDAGCRAVSTSNAKLWTMNSAPSSVSRR
jgi:glycerol uptake operon antiterminator